ncbi:exonuclease domain-containing protein [Haematococcus lacustris]|uniref:Exonuclease domain-containing protein n=1 Tax=Haematococcus lacustris TaxID=44745 RepID=A0A6A0AEF2_HAELA|nr:exonuclease domain-containing protein [Haematococcus lacustris]
MECRWRNILTPAYLRRWCDLRKVFASKLKPAGNLKASVETVGLTWQGRAHSGLDDARNTANLALGMA